jgi:hypothetical protein
MADLFDALHHAALGTPFCSSTPFHTPNGAVCATGVHKQYKCRHQVDQSAEQPLVLLDCITKPPAMWRYDFVHTFVVAEDDLPPNMGGRLSVDWEQYIQDGGATAYQGGWWVHKPPGRIALVGSGTCGPFCNIAKSVALYLAEHFGPALPVDQVTNWPSWTWAPASARLPRA